MKFTVLTESIRKTRINSYHLEQNTLSEKQFEGKSAIVTGGTRGIGKAIVLDLAKRGCNVAFNFSKSADEAVRLKGEGEALGVKAYAA